MFRLITRREARAEDPALTSWIVAADDEAAADRLGVYAGMYLRRLVDTLAETFPRVRDALGIDGFEELSTRYLEAHPSEDPDVRNVGRAFARFVPEALSKLARVEWARVEAFDAEDAASPLARSDLARVPTDAWPSLELALVPSARIVDDTIVWRRGFVVYERAVPAAEARALTALKEGCTFAEACEAFAVGDEDPRAILAALEQWLVDELLTRSSPRAG